MLLSELSVFAVKVLSFLNPSSPRRRQERKGRQESRTSILLLNELSVFEVKVLSFASKSELVGIFCRITLKTY